MPMKTVRTFALIMMMGIGAMGMAQTASSSQHTLSVQMEELTAPDFVQAVTKSEGVCLLPMGIIEKHGPQLPIGSDILQSRELARRAALKEYAVIFPPYFVGQINEARHQPGVIAYSHETIWNMLQETLNELSRNGFKKIIIVNGHGGNNDFLNYFCMSQLESPKDYTVVVFEWAPDSAYSAKFKSMLKSYKGDHADEAETSMVMAIRPDLVELDKANSQSGANQKRLSKIPFMYTGIWWFARYPNHYAGDAGKANADFGNFQLNYKADQLAKLISIMKKDNTIKTLQDEFYREAQNPLNTKQ